ncbi:hypothetical protein ACS0TY_032818 [Phlomoides rotata]
MSRNQEVWKSTWFVVLLVFALGAKSGKAALEYPDVVTTLLPCYDYLVGKADEVTSSCCQSANDLNGMVHSKPDLRTMCEYLKTIAARLQIIVPRAQAIPRTCHIQLPAPIDPNTNCNRYLKIYIVK